MNGYCWCLDDYYGSNYENSKVKNPQNIITLRHLSILPINGLISLDMSKPLEKNEFSNLNHQVRELLEVASDKTKIDYKATKISIKNARKNNMAETLNRFCELSQEARRQQDNAISILITELGINIVNENLFDILQQRIPGKLLPLRSKIEEVINQQIESGNLHTPITYDSCLQYYGCDLKFFSNSKFDSCGVCNGKDNLKETYKKIVFNDTNRILRRNNETITPFNTPVFPDSFSDVAPYYLYDIGVEQLVDIPNLKESLELLIQFEPYSDETQEVDVFLDYTTCSTKS
ncbi:unnamed protein product [Gordionus sp. m RMFG-2023]